MFEAITLEIKRELGPLTPNWFEELTLRASRSDGKEVEVPECPCHEDFTFEPTDVDTKTTSANQISTPMPFLSPPTFLTEEHEQCPAAAHTSSLTDSSPYLFGSTRERGLPKSSIDINIAGGEDTPKRALFEAQRISESLGAQINPNLSWTSSFNTPSSLTPTVVLPKRPESSCTVKPTEEHIVFVRKLFPPAFADPQTSDDRLIIKQKNKPERSLNGDIDVSGVFNQSVPHTAEDDGEVPATVESVLDGSEDILSFLFTSRRTRATEPTRAARSPILKGSSQAAATHNVLDAQTKLDEQIDGPLKNRGSEVTQWTPLSLPECTGTSLDQGYFTVSSVTKKHSPQHTNDCEHDYATQGDGLQRSLGCMPKSRAELKWDAPPKCGSTPYALNASHMFRKPNTLPCSIKNSAQELCRPHHQPAAKLSHGGQVVASTQRESEEEKIIPVPDRAKTLLDKSLEAGDQGGAQTASVQGPDLTLTTGEEESSSALPLCSADACSLLTASQRADVSELCNLLEEADSQCEFTQVKSTKVGPSKLVEAVQQSGNEEEWNKGVLITDCDFNDSFPTDIESGMTSSQVVQQAGDNSTPAAKNSTESSSDGRQMFVSAKHTGEIETVSEERHSKRRKMSHCQSFEQLVPSGTRSALSNIAPYNARVQPPGLKRVNFSSAVKLSQEQDDMTNTSNCFEAITDEEMCVSTEVGQASLPVIDMPSRTDWGETEHVLKNYSRGNAGGLPYIKSEGLMNETDQIANGDIRFGFSTAGGKHVSVSKKALKKAHKLFEECDETPMEMNFDVKLGKGCISTDPEAKNTLNTNQIGDHTSAEDQLKSFGFSTADGKEVSVSKKALQEAHKLFDKCDEMSTDIIQQMSSETANTRDRKHAEQPTGFGFSTAGGKRVSLSKKALQQAHKFFEKCDNETPMNGNFDLKLGKTCSSTDSEAKNTTGVGDQKHAQQSFTGFGFSTAGGKDVHVSRNALKAAHKLFEKCDDTPTETTQHEDQKDGHNKPLGSFGFSTARGKEVSVSKKALQQAHKLFEKCDETPVKNNSDGKLGKACISMGPEAKNTRDRKHAEQPTGFGFSTASGKGVSVSNKALQQAHKLFETCDEMSTDTIQQKDPRHGGHSLGSFGFSTAGGKDVSVSKKALQEAHKLFETCGDEAPMKSNSDLKLSKPCSSTDSETNNTTGIGGQKHAQGSFTSFGFSTAGGKEVSVSKKALQQAHKLFEKCDETPINRNSSSDPEAKNTLNRIQTGDQKQVEESLTSFGFSTAGGKGVSVSKMALQQAHKLFETCEETPMKSHSDLKLSKPCISTDPETKHTLNTTGIGDRKRAEEALTSFGFSTAGGKEVSVSKKALQQAHKLFETCDETPMNGNSSTDPEAKKPLNGILTVDQKHAEESLTSFGFSTAGGKNVSVSKKALQQAHKLFEKCDEMSTDTIPQKDPKHGGHSLGSFGFSTAGGKDVSVSKKALQQAHKLFETCDDEAPMKSHSDLKLSKPCSSTDSETKNTTGIGDQKHAQQSFTSFGFSTAGGKGVSVSKKALQQAHKLFEKCDDETSMNRNSSTDPEAKNTLNRIQTGDQKHAEESLTSFGFSTAGGKNVSVSKKALKEAHKLFDKCDEMSTDTANQEDQKPGGNSLGSFGFSTAGGKDVSVSKKALQEAHKLFETCDETPMKSNSDLKLPKPCSSTDPETKSTRFGFSTARGKEVSVSKKALQEAHKLFEKCDDVSTLTAQQEDINPGDHSLATSGFGTAGGKDEPVCEEACKRFEKSNVRPTDRRQYISSEKTCLSSIQSQVDYPASRQSNQYNARIEKQPVAESIGHAVGLSSYTDPRRQRYFEQEAIACAEALLEDDRLQKCALLGPSQPHQMGNRTVDLEYCSEDQPPQRRDSKSSRRFLVPMTSSPNVALSDRKVKHNVLLQANRSHPHRTTVAPRKQSDGPVPPTVESSSGKRLMEGVPAFVPPYRKRANIEQQNTGEAKSVAQAAVPEIKMEVNGVQTSVCPAAEPGGPQIYNKTTCHSETRVWDNLIPIDSQHNIPQDKDTHDSNHRSELSFDDESPNTHVDMDVLMSSTISEKALECMCLARDMQDLRIRKKKIQSVRPLPGSVFLTKTSGSPRVSIQAAVGYTCPQQHPKESLYLSGVRSEVCQVSGRSAQVFQFRWEHHFKGELLCQGGGVQLADGGWLIPDAQGRMGKEQFYRALCDTPGVDPRLISEEWVYNHYRWIVWKRAAMERAFPREFGGLCLGPEQVLLQLKYRYDVEVDKSQRSALRRIIERDDTPSKTLVLCVCDIIDTSSQTTPGGNTKADRAGLPTTLWLTDGWYSVRAQLDPPLTALVQRGGVRVGMKLVTHGAELVGPQDACHPLEAPETLMLKISANSTRPARWHAKLGYHRDPRPYRVPLASLFSDGGVVSCIDFLVLRSYPIQWMEKTGAGAFIFRSERAEEREARLHEERKQKAMDTLFTGIQATVEKEEEQERRKRRGHKKRLSDQELRALRDGEELHEAVESDPTLQGSLCEEQRASLLSFRQSLTEKRQMRLQERCRRALREAQEQVDGGVPSREATPVWKLAVCDANEPGDLTSKDSIFQLNIWRPSMDLRSLLKEGGRYVGYNLSTSEGKRKTTANVQLTATKKTRFENGKVVPELLVECFQSRQCISFSSLQSPSFRSLCGEVDVMGYIIHIADQNGPSPVVYLADEAMDFVSVRFPSSLRQLAVDELSKPRGFLIVSNALLRQASAPIPSLSAGEFTVLKTSSVEHQIQEQLKQLKSSIQSQEHFFKDAEEKLLSLVHTPSQPGSRTPKQSFYSDDAATAASGVKRTPQASCASEGNNPKSLKRKRGLDYLSRIPSPPPLRPLLAPGTSSSVHVKKVFNPPRRSERLSTGGNIIQTPLLPRATVALSSASASTSTAEEEEWVKDEELALINM